MKGPALAVLFVASLLSDCENAVASEANGRSIEEGQTAGRGGLSGSAIRLTDIRKFNGQEQEFGESRVYEMEYEAEFECLESVSPLDLINICVGKRPSDTVTQRGNLTFEETKRGWRGEHGNIY